MRRPLLLVSLLASATAYALPPGSVPTLETGANHHIGDASFIEAFGRPPTRKRAALIAALDRYIAKGTTPKNTLLP